MAVPRSIVLTNAKPGEHVTEYLTDRERFPAEPLFTTDVAKARTWGYPPGVRRWIKRHLAVLPMLKDCRRVWVADEAIRMARKADGQASMAPADPIDPANQRKRPRLKLSTTGKLHRRGKLNPNKAPRKGRGKPRKPAVAKRPAPRTGRKANRTAKAA